MSRKRSREEAGLTAEEEAQLLHAGPHTEGGFLQLQVGRAARIFPTRMGFVFMYIMSTK